MNHHILEYALILLLSALHLFILSRNKVLRFLAQAILIVIVIIIVFILLIFGYWLLLLNSEYLIVSLVLFLLLLPEPSYRRLLKRCSLVQSLSPRIIIRLLDSFLLWLNSSSITINSGKLTLSVCILSALCWSQRLLKQGSIIILLFRIIFIIWVTIVVTCARFF